MNAHDYPNTPGGPAMGPVTPAENPLHRALRQEGFPTTVGQLGHNLDVNERALTHPEGRHALHQDFNQEFAGTRDTDWKSTAKAGLGLVAQGMVGAATDNIFGSAGRALHAFGGVHPPPPSGTSMAMARASAGGAHVPQDFEEAVKLGTFSGSNGKSAADLAANAHLPFKAEPVVRPISAGGVKAEPLPGVEQGVNAMGTYKMHIPELGGDHIVKLEDFTGKARTPIESFVHHIDQLMPTVKGGKAGVQRSGLVPPTHVISTDLPIPPPAGHPNQTPIDPKIAMSAQEFVPGTVSLRGATAGGPTAQRLQAQGWTGWHPDFVRMNALDHIVGNPDRHTGNVLWRSSDDTLHAIDNGQASLAGAHIDNMDPFHGRTFQYGDYPTVKGWTDKLGTRVNGPLDANGVATAPIVGSTDKPAMMKFLQDSHEYAQRAVSNLSDDALNNVFQKHMDMVRDPAYNVSRVLQQRMEVDLKNTYAKIIQNRDRLIPKIQEHMDALNGKVAHDPFEKWSTYDKDRLANMKDHARMLQHDIDKGVSGAKSMQDQVHADIDSLQHKYAGSATPQPGQKLTLSQVKRALGKDLPEAGEVTSVEHTPPGSSVDRVNGMPTPTSAEMAEHRAKFKNRIPSGDE